MRVRRSYLDRENGLSLFGGAVLSEGGIGSPRPGSHNGHSINLRLLGRALATVVTCAAHTLRVPGDHVVRAAGVTLLDAPSLKAAWDIDWQDPTAQAEARLLAEVDRCRRGSPPRRRPPPRRRCRPRSPRYATPRRKTSSRIRPPASGESAVRSPPTASPRLGRRPCGMGARRRCAPFTGFKRHVVKLIDADVMVEAVVRPANEPEHTTLAHVPAVRAHGARRHSREGVSVVSPPSFVSKPAAPQGASGACQRCVRWSGR